MKYLLTLLFFISKITLAAPAPWVGLDLNSKPCKQLGPGYGPYDYLKRDQFHKELDLVESTHFHADIENIVDKTRRTGDTQGDLHYTLNAWPNHPRALLSVIRYQFKLDNKLMRPIPLATSPECYLQRAIHFNKLDPAPHALMAYYLSELAQNDKAIEHYEKALSLSPNNTRIHYSYGLFLVKLKQYEKALEHAKKAYENGKPPPSLKNKLINLGVWH